MGEEGREVLFWGYIYCFLFFNCMRFWKGLEYVVDVRLVGGGIL